MKDINSPCVRNCCLDENDICMGCLRTMDEILQWSQASSRLKSEIINRVSQRHLERLASTQEP